MKTLLVTGGAGFIGSNFLNYILNKRNDLFIVTLDKLTYAGNLENLVKINDNSNYQFVRGDICNEELVDYLFSKYKFDYLVNFAAESHVDRSILGSASFYQSNVIGTNILLETSKKYGIQKFLQISTDEVYGSLGKHGYFTESTPLSPNSPYAASKAAADQMVMAFHHTFGIPAVISRCSNNYGPYQFPEKLIPLMIINALNDKKLPVYGDGLNVRDWIYVVDHNRAVEMILEKGIPGEVYNIGAGNEIENINIVKLILKKLGKPDSLIEFVKDRPGHDRRYAIDATKIHSELGWKPEYDFESAIDETISWYLENKEWWEKIISGEYKNYYKLQYGN
ncbi:MAG: dTDP-glucose 4,6-dehydratase [Ignavibacteriaceae bacterium]